MAEQGRARQSMTHTQQPVSNEVNDLMSKESDPVVVETQTDSTVKVMQSVFTAMKKHFDNARKEALSLPNSHELAALLAHLSMAEVAMDTMVAHAEGSLV